jgi:acyl-coenzyme A synthetase/AMP-(fatty) acid ligase/thioesterase domain-containing protein/acyl carrier protein
VLASAATAPRAAEAAAGICPIERVDALDTRAITTDAGPPGDPDSLACVYFTSGTTGEPKGVMDSHRNVLHNVMRYTNALDWNEKDRLSLLQASHFSGAVSNVFGALLNGALLLPYDVARDGAGEPLARWIEREQPTVLHGVPSLFRSICVAGARFPSVRVVRLEGDSGAPRDAGRFAAHFLPGSMLVHGLGATETGISCQFFLRQGEPSPGDALPIGTPTTDMTVRVLDDTGDPVPAGGIGEIAVRSRYLALGYWRDPERTSAAFRADPTEPALREYRTGDLGRFGADGALRHLGRRDSRFRIGGLWVDTAALESQLAALRGVSEAAVAPARIGQDDAVLTAFVVPSGEAPPTMIEIRRALTAALPAHSIPRRGFALDALPLGANGKLDRRALLDVPGRPLAEGAGEAPPRDATEATLVDIWRRVLGLERVGIHDRFVELGGDSLRATEVAVSIETRLGVRVSQSALAEAPTIAGLAARVRAEPRADVPRALVTLRGTGSRAPLFGVHELESDAFLFSPLALRLGEDQPVYGLRLPAGEPLSRLPRTIEALAARYLDEVTAIAPRGPYHIAGFCFGGTVALEMARQLAARGERIALLALLNVTAYDLMTLVSPAARRRFRARLGARLRYLWRKPDALTWVRRRVVAAAGDHLAARALESRLAALPGDAPTTPGLVRAALRAGFDRHVPRRHEGDIALFLADETLPLYADDPHEAWAGVATGRIEIHRLPHDGYAMLSEPDVARLAETLRRRMDPIG